MVALLSIVGILTSAFFFVVRAIHATIVFHNFLGMFGVMQALVASGALTALQPPLLIMATATVGVLGAAEHRDAVPGMLVVAHVPRGDVSRCPGFCRAGLVLMLG